MSTNRIVSKKERVFSNIVTICLVLAIVTTCVIGGVFITKAATAAPGESAINRRIITDLSEEVIHTQGNLRLSIEVNSGVDGLDPVTAFDKAEKAFKIFKDAAKNIPKEDISFRARQLLQDGPYRPEWTKDLKRRARLSDGKTAL